MISRVVLDTNIIVSAALYTDRRPALLVRLVLSGAATLIASEYILQEYNDVLHRPRFSLHSKQVSSFVRLLRVNAEIVKPVEIPDGIVSDPSDGPILGTARAGKADFLVTGNSKHFPQKYGQVDIVTANEFFLKLLGEL